MIDKEFGGSFYNEDYFQRGQETKKGWLKNYRWLPRRTFKEAFAFIDTLGLNEDCRVLEVGCSYGFLVKALRTLEIPTDGCDISEHALGKAREFVGDYFWNCSSEISWKAHSKKDYSHIIVKDMLEHLSVRQLEEMLHRWLYMADEFMVVIPMGKDGKYLIPEYHLEVSHILIEGESWWIDRFESNGWEVTMSVPQIAGLKDNWVSVNPLGNRVFVGKKKQ